MNRRNFLSVISAGIAGIALEQAIPLGRVWSFPKKIVIARNGETLEPGDRFTIAGVNFVAGDVISLPAFGPERYVVSHQTEDGDVHLLPQRDVGGGVIASNALHAIQRLKFAGFDPEFRKMALKDGY